MDMMLGSRMDLIMNNRCARAPQRHEGTILKEISHG
jgi:hypothetical protein